jgi:hypothetical protein
MACVDALNDWGTNTYGWKGRFGKYKDAPYVSSGPADGGYAPNPGGCAAGLYAAAALSTVSAFVTYGGLTATATGVGALVGVFLDGIGLIGEGVAGFVLIESVKLCGIGN